MSNIKVSKRKLKKGFRVEALGSIVFDSPDFMKENFSCVIVNKTDIPIYVGVSK